jgi:hypothetical protein
MSCVCRYAAALTSLIWSLQAQDSAEGDREGAVTLVVVVPTEPGSAAVLRDYVSRYTDAYLLDPTPSGVSVGRRRSNRMGAMVQGQTLAVLVMDPTTQDFVAQR